MPLSMVLSLADNEHLPPMVSFDTELSASKVRVKRVATLPPGLKRNDSRWIRLRSMQTEYSYRILSIKKIRENVPGWLRVSLSRTKGMKYVSSSLVSGAERTIVRRNPSAPQKVCFARGVVSIQHTKFQQSD